MTDKSWAVYECRHVVPVNDLTEHELSAKCWCGPREEDVEGPSFMFVHHSADQREDKEQTS